MSVEPGNRLLEDSAREAVGDGQHAELAAGRSEDGATEVPIQDLSEDAPVDAYVAGAVQGRRAVCGERGASGPTAADEEFDGGLVWLAARGPTPQSCVAVGLDREAHSVLLDGGAPNFVPERRLPDARVLLGAQQ